MSRIPSLVDQALDKYVELMGTRGIDPKGVRAKVLAAAVDIPVSEMSRRLQTYRYRQSKGKTRYTIGCEGYGGNARWVILSKPTSDPKRVQVARNDHAQYLAKDNLRKTLRDYVSEVFPALQSGERDHVVEVASRGLLQHMEIDVQTAVQMMEAS